jgi:aminopeptidase YwaD
LFIFVAVRKLGIMINKSFGIIRILSIAGFLIFAACAPQKVSLDASLKADISYLASDALEGRMTGEAGEQLAAEYIAKRFTEIGLTQIPGQQNFFAEFDFSAMPVIGEHNSLLVDGRELTQGDDFYPVSWSASGSATGKLIDVGFAIEDGELKHNDFSTEIPDSAIFLIDISSPDGIHPHSKFLKHHDVLSRISAAMRYNPMAVILHTKDAHADIPTSEMRRSGRVVSIPVLFLNDKTLIKSGENISLSVDIKREDKVGRNVLGYLNNGAANTIVLGAHYDHLGFGEEHSSLHRGEKAIHYGADDNASGVAAIIALADWAKTDGPKTHNYIFAAFSGEELGLLGSNALVKDSIIDLNSLSFMLNFDMVGRLDSVKNTLIVSGSGTSPQWSFLDSARYDFVKIKLNESGIGPSDHTPFYLKNIPVLAFFSGTHPDYHKPTDVESQINYAGLIKILDVAKDVIVQASATPKLEFVKTKDDEGRGSPRFKVTLGVVPDYAYSGNGMRIDGVSAGKPAEVAGLQAGDIVVKLGDLPVNDMTSYMKALGYFAKGDSTEALILREGVELTKPIRF